MTKGGELKRFLALFYKNLILLFLLMPLVLLLCCLGVGAAGYFEMKTNQPPSIEDAPWAAQTFSEDGMRIPSRLYYASEVAIIRGEMFVKDYWTFDGKRYKKHTGEKALPKNSRFIRRRQ